MTTVTLVRRERTEMFSGPACRQNWKRAVEQIRIMSRRLRARDACKFSERQIEGKGNMKKLRGKKTSDDGIDMTVKMFVF